ncbi:MAG TPA: S8 family peptidase [Actinomycetota bacterium]
MQPAAAVAFPRRALVSRDLRGLATAILALCLMAAGFAPATGAAGLPLERAVSVIVRGDGIAAARDAVRTAGGRVVTPLPLVDSVEARVDERALDALVRRQGILSVSPDAPVGFHGTGDGSGITHRIQKVVRSTSLWQEGTNGSGVTVAVLDTGIYAAHPDLAGRVVHCEDFSHEETTEARCADTFGHGTFMAGLIAGDGSASNGKYVGAAPGANLVSVKVAGYDGSSDVSNVLAGIQWVVAHRDEYGIRVLNLSLGTDSAQDYRFSPLNYAVEKAWRAGIVVVASGGNTGPNASTVMKPGDDPFIITVGASNDEGSMTIDDDTVPIFSARGPTRANGFAKPDVVSPGVHTVSLRSPGSAIDQKYGSSAVVSDDYFRGTGTSMATATVSGIVAQILQRNPGLTPDQVKYRLTSTARPIAEGTPIASGNGIVDAFAAATATTTDAANAGLSRSNGLGSIASDRGSLGLEVVGPAGEVGLSGEYVAQTDPARVGLANPAGFVPFVAVDYSTTGWDASSWQASSWQASSWQASSWQGSSWQGSSWQGSSWQGSSWQASSWQSAWYAASWD